MAEDKIIPCVCLTCGIRNDFSTENGYCQNGHDDWLEYRDVFLLEDAPKETVNRAKKVFDMDIKTLKKTFIDVSIKQFVIKNNGKNNSRRNN